MVDYKNPSSTVDMIVPYDGGIILIKRRKDPFKGYWALPGGFLNCGAESLEEAAIRELAEETSLVAKVQDLKLVGVYSDPARDPRGHVISHVYLVTRFSGTALACDDACAIRAFRKIPRNLAFDHDRILKDALSRHDMLEKYEVLK
jgi:8-oxo-dGTP diphosphatase